MAIALQIKVGQKWTPNRFGDHCGKLNILADYMKFTEIHADNQVVNMPTLIRYIVATILLTANIFAFADEAGEWKTVISMGIDYRQQGNLSLSIDLLTRARQVANTEAERMRATGELGATLLQARQFDQADASLQEAYSFFSGIERARYALDMGNLSVVRKRQKDAQAYYEEALQLAGSDAVVHASAGLNLARMALEPEKLKKLTSLFQEINNIDNASSRVPLYLNLGNQAHKLGNRAIALTYQSLDQSRQLLAKVTTKSRLHVETLDALAQLYEDQDRKNDALILTQQAATDAHTLAPGIVGDLLINIEGRLGRLYRATGKDELALAAYQRAVNQIETLRQDIPVEYEDGRSSFRYTFEPTYLGFADLLLQAADKQPVGSQAAYFRRAIDTIELIKQSELQDYLGDRCTVETVKGGSATVIPSGTAVLYPIIFRDRIELLLETKNGIVRHSIRIPDSIVRQVVVGFADDLRNGTAGYLLRSQQLYDWLFRPLEKSIAEQRINTLVIVPDSALRLIAMGALHDGSNFAIEKFAITSVTGLSMTNTNSPPKQGLGFLVAGVSEPGPVVDKLSQATVDQILAPDAANKESVRGLARTRSLRSLRLLSASPIPAGDTVKRSAALREALSLPGVKQEIEAISRIMPSTSMLNEAFTVDSFRRNAGSGAYRIVHIASHGVFGGSADASYILAYDDVLTMDGLQSLLKSDHFQEKPIELLTLSACETAEGDDRSPLGISGASIKARAKSVLGTLWPVEDNAARKVMEDFYSGLTANQLSKAEALRRAQVELIHSDEFAHPFFWAPFVLIGNWL